MLNKDILDRHLFPFLDWQSRLNLNLALPFDMRSVKTMSKYKIIGHEKKIIVDLFKGKMEDFEHLDNTKKPAAISDIFISLLSPRNKILYIYNTNLRTVVLSKAIQWKSAKRILETVNIPKKDAISLALIARHTIKTINLDIKNLKIYPDRYLFTFAKSDIINVFD